MSARTTRLSVSSGYEDQSNEQSGQINRGSKGHSVAISLAAFVLAVAARSSALAKPKSQNAWIAKFPALLNASGLLGEAKRISEANVNNRTEYKRTSLQS